LFSLIKNLICSVSSIESALE